MVRLFTQTVLTGVLLTILAGCAALAPHPGHLPVSERPEAAKRFFQTLDQAVDRAGANDAAAFKIPGYPYLRADRFLAAFEPQAMNAAQTRFWIGRLQALDQAARRREIANLPRNARTALPAAGMPPGNLNTAMERASDALLQADLKDPQLGAKIKAALQVPEEYRDSLRVIGLYPLSALPVAVLTHRVRGEFRAWFETPLPALTVRGRLIRYVPADRTPLDAARLRKILNRSRQNPLGVFAPTAQQTRELAAMLAPVLAVDTVGGYDRLGRPGWQPDGATGVDTALPSVYFYLTRAFAAEEPLLQLNYAVWFPARAAPASWFERGPLDGLTVRVSLRGDGTVAMVDGINNCGCYHYMVPAPGLIARQIFKPWRIEPFIAQPLPHGFPTRRLHLRISTGWHQVQRLHTSPDPAATAVPYVLRPYEDLERLPLPGGGRRSLFDPRGIAYGSPRIEPLLLFPMGVPKVGSMRQRGHHAIEFVGKAHFDDPQLFNGYFEFSLPH